MRAEVAAIKAKRQTRIDEARGPLGEGRGKDQRVR